MGIIYRINYVVTFQIIHLCIIDSSHLKQMKQNKLICWSTNIELYSFQTQLTWHETTSAYLQISMKLLRVKMKKN